MRLINKGSAAGLVLLAALSSMVIAQGVVPKSKDVAGTLAFNGQGGVDGNMHPSFGLSGAYNGWGKLAAVGEFEYQPFGATPALRQTIQLVGGGGRYYFMTSPHMAPYVVATGGFARIGTNQIGTGLNSSEKGGYFAAGAGASFYVGENWGIRPEVRFQDELIGNLYPFKEVQGSVSLYYQFGGSATAEKKK